MAGVSVGVTTDAIVGAIDKDENGNYKPQGIIASVDKIGKGKDVITSVFEGIVDVGGNALGGATGPKTFTSLQKISAKARIEYGVRKALPNSTKDQRAIARANFQDAVTMAEALPPTGTKPVVCTILLFIHWRCWI